MKRRTIIIAVAVLAVVIVGAFAVLRMQSKADTASVMSDSVEVAQDDIVEEVADVTEELEQETEQATPVTEEEPKEAEETTPDEPEQDDAEQEETDVAPEETEPEPTKETLGNETNYLAEAQALWEQFSDSMVCNWETFRENYISEREKGASQDSAFNTLYERFQWVEKQPQQQAIDDDSEPKMSDEEINAWAAQLGLPPQNTDFQEYEGYPVTDDVDMSHIHAY